MSLLHYDYTGKRYDYTGKRMVKEVLSKQTEFSGAVHREHGMNQNELCL